MTSAPRISDPASLPGTLPLFPLTGALLLPHGQLPLNIFERRYLNMIEDAMAGEHLIGMIQPVEAEPGLVSEQAEVFDVGCAGRISSFQQTGDDRYFITLQGVCRFIVDRELAPARGYRRAAVSYDVFLGDLGDETGTLDDRPRLLKAVNEFFGFRNISPDWQTIEDTDDVTLVSSLAMICPFETREKQGLLECGDLDCRAQLLTSLFEMGNQQGAAPASATRH